MKKQLVATAVAAALLSLTPLTQASAGERWHDRDARGYVDYGYYRPVPPPYYHHHHYHRPPPPPVAYYYYAPPPPPPPTIVYRDYGYGPSVVLNLPLGHRR